MYEPWLNQYLESASLAPRDINSACKRCNLMKTDEIICDAGANSTNSRVEVMQNAAKIS